MGKDGRLVDNQPSSGIYPLHIGEDRESNRMDLSVKVGNVKLKNPVILASAGYTATRNGLERYIRKGFGAVVTKTTTIKPLEGSPPPRMFWYDPDRKSMLAGAEALRTLALTGWPGPWQPSRNSRRPRSV